MAGTGSSCTCRICLSSQDTEHLIRPCNCRGTMEFVHAFCLQNWIAVSSRLSCEVCQCGYRGRKMSKYGVLSSIYPYLQARWYQPKINLSLLFVFHLIEQIFLETRDYYTKKGKYRSRRDTLKCRLFASIVFRWLTMMLNPRHSLLVTMVLRDWSTWMQTQVIFVLDRKTPPK
ncbi:probable E3 ubiquitin-protein ligase MARCHF10 [Planococcus citri]|uniref:probable E3 ubiquitin-protein ligase MARCHF10 n=1 Tax=Planococcus citri TaxID=170843 RepID=UPI0031F86828